MTSETTQERETAGLPALIEPPANNLPAVRSDVGLPAQSRESGEHETERRLPELPPALVTTQLAAMRDWDPDYSARLEAKWGVADMASNLYFAAAFLKTYPEIHDALSITPGNCEYADHPRLIECAAILGRLWAKTPGNPASVKKLKGAPMTEGEAEQVQDRIDELQNLKTEALRNGDRAKANRYDRQQYDLIAKTQGNQPIVGAALRKT